MGSTVRVRVAAFWAVIYRPPTLAWAVGGATVGAAAALSDPLTALLLPAAAVAVYRYRSRLHTMVVAIMFAGLAIQGLVVIGAEHRVGTEASWADLPIVYAFRVAGSLVIGDGPLGGVWDRAGSSVARVGTESSILDPPLLYALRVGGDLIVGDVHLTGAWDRAGNSVAVVAVVALTLVTIAALSTTQGWSRFLVAAAVANSLLFFAVPLLVRGTETLVPIIGERLPLHSGRYTLVPVMFIVLCIAVVLDSALGNWNLQRGVAAAIGVVWILIVIGAKYLIAPHPDGPSWTATVNDARSECTLKNADEMIVEVAPNSNWEFSLLCDDL